MCLQNLHSKWISDLCRYRDGFMLHKINCFLDNDYWSFLFQINYNLMSNQLQKFFFELIQMERILCSFFSLFWKWMNEFDRYAVFECRVNDKLIRFRGTKMHSEWYTFKTELKSRWKSFYIFTKKLIFWRRKTVEWRKGMRKSFCL